MEWDQAWYYTISKLAGDFWPDELSFSEQPFDQEYIQKYKHVFENRIFRTLYAYYWTRNRDLNRWEDPKGWFARTELGMTNPILKINFSNHSFFNKCSFICHRDIFNTYDVMIVIYNKRIYKIPEHDILNVSKIFYAIYENSLRDQI